MTLAFYIIAAMLIIYAGQVVLNKSKPVSGFYFYMQLFSSIALLCLVWSNTDPETKVEYRILLTAVAGTSILQCYLSYKKRKASAP